MQLCFAAPDDRAVKVHLVKAGVAFGDVFPHAEALAASHGFKGSAGAIVYGHEADGALAHVLYGIGKGQDALCVAGLSAKLPEGVYQVAADGGMPFAHIAAGWADGAYRFDRYLARKSAAPQLVIPKDADADAINREAAAVDHLRDLVNTPAQDLGPQNIQADIEALGKVYDAEVSAIVGDDLLTENYPMIHAVGRAGDADYAPRLVHLTWGDPSHPKLALVGKGVSFDSGGLNIKPGGSMRIMKKDMGGAAHAIALAELIMGAKLPVHLSLFVPTVENAIAGNAFRPGDILQSRKGLTVEIDNTDAEGRLILGDALTRASEDDPDMLIDFATLTGAARVALGADLAPIYTDDDALAAAIEAGSARSGDPVWRMPLWAPYLSDLSSPIADLVNSGGGFGGSITAGLFLKEFVDAKRWVHLDVWAWRKGKYSRPEGGAACGLRAMWDMLQAQYG